MIDLQRLVYPSALMAFILGQIDVVSDTINAQLLASTYVADVLHENFDDVPALDRIGSPVALTSKTVADGTFKADPPVFVALTMGDTVRGYVVYKDTGTEATSPLLCYVRRRRDSRLVSWPTDGGDVEIIWDDDLIMSL